MDLVKSQVSVKSREFRFFFPYCQDSNDRKGGVASTVSSRQWHRAGAYASVHFTLHKAATYLFHADMSLAVQL